MWDKSIKKQRGTALITALFIMSLVVIIAARVSFQESVLIHETSLVSNADQAFLALQGSQDWGMGLLANALKAAPKADTSSGVTRLPTEATSFVTQLNAVKLHMHIRDMENRLNINALYNIDDTDKEKAFVALFMLQGLSQRASVALVKNIVEYISMVNLASVDAYYLKQDPPYRAPHHPLVDISELRLVRGMTPALYAKIAPLVVVLPTNKLLLNINAMRGQSAIKVLSTLPGATPEIASQLVSCAQNSILTSQEQASSICGPMVQGFLSKNKAIQYTSHYFVVEATSQLAAQRFILETLLHIAPSTDQVNQKKIQILWQHFVNTGVD